jgi:predicted nucleotidyltransferase
MDQPKVTDVAKLLVQAGQDADVLAVLLYGGVARGERFARSDTDICLVLMPRSTPREE